MALTESELHCLGEVRRHDRERYLAALFLPADRRADALALQAFNLEIARTREIVSEPLLGRIRLQWWREAVAGIYDGAPRKHPVVEALAAAVARRDLPRDALERMIDAREADLDDEPPPSLDALERYAADTSGRLSALVMTALDAESEAAGRAARQVGTAWALVGLARSIPFHARSRRLYVPEELLAGHAADRARLFDLKPSPGLSQAVARIAGRAEGLIADARAAPRIPKPARRGLLLACLADGHIAALRAAGHDPFAIPAARSPPVLRLGWAAWRGKF